MKNKEYQKVFSFLLSCQSKVETNINVNEEK